MNKLGDDFGQLGASISNANEKMNRQVSKLRLFNKSAEYTEKNYKIFSNTKINPDRNANILIRFRT